MSEITVEDRQIRQTGINVLSSFINRELNREIIEKEIFTHSNGTEEYLDNIYQIIGLIQSGTSLKDIRQICRNNKFGWQNPCFDKISTKITEFDDYLAKPFDIADGVVECPKCGSTKTWSVQKQTRASDEPMTTFSRCAACGHNWRYAG
jgi:DNA-directed RNA polymerase subunit M/transcription elongation factor TFIIS